MNMLRLNHSAEIKNEMMLQVNPNLAFKEEPGTRAFIRVKPTTSKELCDLYGVSSKTLKKWLAPFESEIGGRNCSVYTVVQVEGIFSRMGVPVRVTGDAFDGV